MTKTRQIIFVALVAAAVLLGWERRPGGVARGGTADAVTHFVIRSASLGTTFQVVRLDPNTGESWTALNGKWTALTDTTPVGTGTYDIQLFALANGTYQAVRTDSTTGRTWYLNNTQWVLIAG